MPSKSYVAKEINFKYVGKNSWKLRSEGYFERSQRTFMDSDYIRRFFGFDQIIFDLIRFDDLLSIKLKEFIFDIQNFQFNSFF